MDKKKKSKSTMKKKSKVSSRWKNYCKKHNLNKKDAKYCFIIFLILIGLLFSIFNTLVSQVQIICLENGGSVSLCYCIKENFKRKPYYLFSNKSTGDTFLNCSLNENSKKFPKTKK